MANVTFSGVTLPNASKINETFTIPIRDTLILTGARSQQTNTRFGITPKFSCFGTQAQYLAVRSLIGTKGSLVIPLTGETYTNCNISSFTRQESDDPNTFEFTLEFKQDTTP